MPGMGSLLTVLLSEGLHRRGLSLERIVKVSSTNPARIFGLYPRKGAIRVGSDADLVLVDVDEERNVDATTWGSGAGYSIYEGWRMKGWPLATMLRGHFLYRDGEVVAEPGYGEYLARGPAGVLS